MKIYEYQGKAILKKYGISIQEGLLASTPHGAVHAARQIQQQTNTLMLVVKAQILAGARGRGGGVKIAKNLNEVYEIAQDLLGRSLVTPQTHPSGQLVREVLVCEDVFLPEGFPKQSFYISIFCHQALSRTMILYSMHGGTDIEAMAVASPHLFFQEQINPIVGLTGYQVRRMATNMQLTGRAFTEMVNCIHRLYEAYVKTDALLFEINPLIKMVDGSMKAIDAKVVIDNNSLHQLAEIHSIVSPQWENIMDMRFPDIEGHSLHGDPEIGLFVDGSGVASMVKQMLRRRNFPCVSVVNLQGVVSTGEVEDVMRLMLRNNKIKAILINILNGMIPRLAIIQGFINVCRDDLISVPPIVMRIGGVSADEVKRKVEKSGIKVTFADTLGDAVNCLSAMT